jgi:hypothetical protein
MMFTLGTIFGAIVATLFVAYLIGRDLKAKQAKQSAGGINVTSAGPAGGINVTSAGPAGGLENTDKQWLENIFKANDRLFEIPPRGQA